MLSKSSNSSDDAIMAEINIVPFTDVMLVLLVIFMVTTPLLVMESFKIKLPSARTGTAEVASVTTVIVTAEGRVLVNDKEVDIVNLTEALEAEFKDVTGEKTVLLKGDKEASHGTVVTVLDSARAAGADKLSIATERGR